MDNEGSSKEEFKSWDRFAIGCMPLASLLAYLLYYTPIVDSGRVLALPLLVALASLIVIRVRGSINGKYSQLDKVGIIGAVSVTGGHGFVCALSAIVKVFW